MEYIASYKDLMRHLGVEVKNAEYHLMQFGIYEKREVTFDAQQYLNNYLDLHQAFGNDRKAAAMHYIASGYSKGLSPDSFDSLRYIASHEDLIKAYHAEGDLVEAGKSHFSTYGFKEGRSITFDSDLYLKNHADLRQQFGNDPEAATRHYITDGFHKRGSLTDLDSLKYIASYEDLIRAYHTVKDPVGAGREHFFKYGFIEGRSISFDPWQYLNKNPDLHSYFKGSYEDAIWDYIARGFWERRISENHSQDNMSEDYFANTASKPSDKSKLHDMQSQSYQKGYFSDAFDRHTTENSFEDVAKFSDDVYNVGDMSLDILH